MKYKYVGIFSISLLVALFVFATIVKSQSYTKEEENIFVQTCISQNKDYSFTNYDIQETITPENVFEYSFEKNALPLLNLNKQDVVIKKINETQFKITIDKNLEDIEYISICNLLDTLKYFYYPNDTIIVSLELPNDVKEIIPQNPTEATQTDDEVFISLEEFVKPK